MTRSGRCRYPPRQRVEYLSDQAQARQTELQQAKRAQFEAEKDLAELKAKHAVEASGQSGVEAAPSHPATRKRVRNMPCELVNGKVGMAQALKDCIDAFNELDR